MFYFAARPSTASSTKYVSHADGQVTGVIPAMFPLTSISNQASSSLHQDPLGSLTPSNNMDSLCDELSKHEYEDIVEVDYSFDTVNVKTVYNFG